MSLPLIAIILLAMLAAPIAWALPKPVAMDAVAAFTIMVLAILSPETAIWLFGATAVTFGSLKLADWTKGRNLVAAITALCLLGALVLSRFSSGFLWIGGSFFTLRLLHVLGDWWMGRLAAPSFRDLARYQFFLPVMVVGPIHRFPNFQRQIVRRRFEWSDFLTGLERCLIGAFMSYFIGEVVIGRATASISESLLGNDGFGPAWLLSAIGWIRLYFVFAGLSAVALGTSLMMGLRLEENFNSPWRAESLLDFWTRWHMSLTEWSRDYVFKPVMALTRSPVAGVVGAMLVIGLWHEISPYYLLWSFWQTLGILVSRQAGKVFSPARLPPTLRRLIVFGGILAWLSLARPIITAILGMTDDTAFAPF